MAELRQEIHQAMTALADERAEKTMLLDGAAHERMELHKPHYEEKERPTMTLQRVQSTYQNQLSHYREQEAATGEADRAIKEQTACRRRQIKDGARADQSHRPGMEEPNKAYD